MTGGDQGSGEPPGKRRLRNAEELGEDDLLLRPSLRPGVEELRPWDPSRSPRCATHTHTDTSPCAGCKNFSPRSYDARGMAEKKSRGGLDPEQSEGLARALNMVLAGEATGGRKPTKVEIAAAMRAATGGDWSQPTITRTAAFRPDAGGGGGGSLRFARALGKAYGLDYMALLEGRLERVGSADWSERLELLRGELHRQEPGLHTDSAIDLAWKALRAVGASLDELTWWKLRDAARFAAEYDPEGAIAAVRRPPATDAGQTPLTGRARR